jgi:hypothetical protein
MRDGQEKNALDSMRVNSESVANEIDESEMHCKKQSEQMI